MFTYYTCGQCLYEMQAQLQTKLFFLLESNVMKTQLAAWNTPHSKTLLIPLLTYLTYTDDKSRFLDHEEEGTTVLQNIGNHRCRYQSITQQYLKRCLIKDDSNYMFWPIAAIIRFTDVCYMLLLRDMEGGYLLRALSWGVQLKYVCSLLSYVRLQILFVHLLWVVRARTTHSKSPPAVDIGNGQTIAGDPHRTAASRHIWAVHPRITHITDNPPNLRIP